MKIMFSLLPKDFNTPIIIVQHLNARSDGQWIKLLNKQSNLNIKEADEKIRKPQGDDRQEPSEDVFSQMFKKAAHFLRPLSVLLTKYPNRNPSRTASGTMTT